MKLPEYLANTRPRTGPKTPTFQNPKRGAPGLVLSFGQELRDYPLTPIQQWAQFDYTWNGELDLDLIVNPTPSAYAIDFRTADEIVRDGMQATAAPVIDGEKLKRAKRLAEIRSGEVGDPSWTYVGRQIPTIKKES